MDIRIELANGTDAEASTRDQLLRLLEEHDLSGWAFTRRVRIERDAIPHSHPVLTLGTRAPHDWALLSAYIHEQLHWLVWEHQDQSTAALREITARYPHPAVGPPDGAADVWSSHLHYLVNFLELSALSQLLGADHAGTYLRRKPFYRPIYTGVVDDAEWLSALCERHGLVLPDRSTGPAADPNEEPVVSPPRKIEPRAPEHGDARE